MKNLMWLEINLANLNYNIKNLKKMLRPGSKFMAVVKSNAYGHGMIECVKAAVAAGADWLGVVSLDEALKLRQEFPISNFSFDKLRIPSPVEGQFPILVMGYTEPEEAIVAAKNNISIAVVNFEQLEKIAYRISHIASRKLKIHLKIETGISRLGFAKKDWPKLIEKIKKLPKNIQIEGIYSHFASVEEYDLAYARKQIEKFLCFKKSFEKNYLPVANRQSPIYHIAASAATMILPEAHFDMVRCGISIYGLWPSPEIAEAIMKIQNANCKNQNNKSKFPNEQFNNETMEQWNNEFLKPVMSYKTKIVQIKEVKRGDYIGYGCTYPVERSMTIAVIPVGYAEGFDRGFSNPSDEFHLRDGSPPATARHERAGSYHLGGEVLIKGIRCPVVGRVCMNMTVIDISKIKDQRPRIKIGDEIILIGGQTVPTPIGSGPRSESIGADEWAEKLGTINYEITTRIPDKIKRIYKLV